MNVIVTIVVIVFGIAILAAMGNGDWGAVAVGAAIIVGVLWLVSCGRRSDRAYCNWEDYWEKGGAERRRR